jgi:2-(1,2-epoxy-1,2-dihydrophenyl)acetyl-CoA isomerase
MEGTTGTVLAEKRDGLAIVTLNRPEVLNALDLVMREELAKILVDLREDSATTVVILTGAGRAFCAGGDIKTMGTEDLVSSRDRIKRLHRWLRELLNLEKPTIAAVNGIAAGIGCNLALACDIAYASDRATFSQPFVRIGLVPDGGGMYLLPRSIGSQRANELFFTGDPIDATEAERIGLVARVVPHDELLSRVEALARRILANAPMAVRLAKAILRRAFDLDLESLLEMEALAQVACSVSDDHREGVAAFREKRAARFKGK